ncbi:zinc ABC transporter substrate-binding protein AztC [Rhodococcus rhodnii]|uniref:ABC metal transporter n=1 Tax=Rhodococcus rhodnii LMG 5362 TaxID=1273125 RepID=R7WSL5_9NOCA|nr:zinc ABC transporter substrate-binding protein AztC [Rhodococcus rhodnii]EOM76994.1 ABC metal transporter [Rhodococcus rhodnii LMG 5362]
MTRRRWIGPCAALLTALFVVTACGGAIADDRPTIVVTTDILGDVTENIVGDEADVLVLMPRGADPHSFEISASDAARVERSSLVIANGSGLEEGARSTVDAARADGVPVLEVGDRVDPLVYDAGRTRGAPDPHFWTDPGRMALAVDAIRASIEENLEASVDRGALAARADDYRTRVEGTAAAMREQFEQIAPPDRKLVTNHHVFGYLADRFGFETIGAVIPSGTTLASPSASDLADLAGVIRDAGVRAIFVDSSQPERLAQALATETGTDVAIVSLFTESLGDENSGAGTYLDMMRSNATAIAGALAT